MSTQPTAPQQATQLPDGVAQLAGDIPIWLAGSERLLPCGRSEPGRYGVVRLLVPDDADSARDVELEFVRVAQPGEADCWIQPNDAHCWSWEEVMELRPHQVVVVRSGLARDGDTGTQAVDGEAPAFAMEEVELTQSQFDVLLEYSTTPPTGKTIGKQWKRYVFSGPHQGEWWLCEYIVDPDPEYVGISNRKIVIKGGA